MLQTNLYLTQTYLNLDNIQKLICRSYFDLKSLEIKSTSEPIDQDNLDQTFNKYRSSQQVILFSPSVTETESQKETFRKFLTSDVYIKYSKPTLLFLGDLTSYSDTLQEGMLKLLEEPPENLIIILFAQSLSILKPTIISRCRIQSFDIQTILSNLDPKLQSKVQKLPSPKEVVENLLNSRKTTIEKPSDFERDEIDFWLWQVQTNLSYMYANSPSDKISESIEKVLMSRKLNYQNLQKKFAIGWLGV
jgi:DNA polymerase III, delta subunit